MRSESFEEGTQGSVTLSLVRHGLKVVMGLDKAFQYLIIL